MRTLTLLLLLLLPACGLFEWPTNQELYQRQDFDLLQLRFVSFDDQHGRDAGRLLRLLNNEYPGRAWDQQRAAIRALYGPLYALHWTQYNPRPGRAHR